jgi:type II secretory pathway component PulF
MKYDEFAFFNQQLAGMLRSGIPLEGALRQLCASMKEGRLRAEFGKIETELAQGVPLDKAISGKDLPPLYVQMVRMGAKSNDLPGVLTLLADYYHRMNSLWTRLKGLMIYPAIVLLAGVGLSLFLVFSSTSVIGAFSEVFSGMGFSQTGWQKLTEGRMSFIMLLPTVVLCLMGTAFAIALLMPRIRNRLRWKVSGFKEASLANFAATLALMLKQGAGLNESLSLIRNIEAQSPLGSEISRWQELLASGRGKVSDLSSGSKLIPPLFFWLLASEGEDWAAGFMRAAEIYHARATNKADMLLFAALPVSVLVLGIFVVGQVLPLVFHTVGSMTQLLDGGF